MSPRMCAYDAIVIKKWSEAQCCEVVDENISRIEYNMSLRKFDVVPERSQVSDDCLVTICSHCSIESNDHDDGKTIIWGLEPLLP